MKKVKEIIVEQKEVGCTFSDGRPGTAKISIKNTKYDDGSNDITITLPKNALKGKQKPIGE